MRKVADKFLHKTKKIGHISLVLSALYLSTHSLPGLAVENSTDASYTQQQLQQLQQLAAETAAKAPAAKQNIDAMPAAAANSLQQVGSIITAKTQAANAAANTTGMIPKPVSPAPSQPVNMAPTIAPPSTSATNAGPVLAAAPVPTAVPAASTTPALQALSQTTAANNNNPPPQAAYVDNAQTEQAPPEAVVDPNLAVKEDAFSGMSQTILPMTPDQIQRLRKMFNASQYAAAAPAGVPPKPTARSQFVNLAPGATPPVVRMAQGLVTSLVFLDSTGASWPIDAYDIGNPAAFNIQWNKTDNTLLVQSMTLYNYGNLAVRLKGLTTPVMLTLVPGQQAVDYRVDLRVQGLGPNATAMPVNNGIPNSANPELLGVLDGIPPTGSRMLSVSGGDCQAWLLGDMLYLRTRYSVLSPSWLATMASADGMRAYQMQKTPMLLVSAHGKPVQLKIEGL